MWIGIRVNSPTLGGYISIHRSYKYLITVLQYLEDMTGRKCYCCSAYNMREVIDLSTSSQHPAQSDCVLIYERHTGQISGLLCGFTTRVSVLNAGRLIHINAHALQSAADQAVETTCRSFLGFLSAVVCRGPSRTSVLELIRAE